MPMRRGMGNACPSCGQVDSVQRVRAAYEEGMSASVTSGTTLSTGSVHDTHGRRVGSTTSVDYTSLTTSTQSRLSMSLTPAKRPLSLTEVRVWFGWAVMTIALLDLLYVIWSIVESIRESLAITGPSIQLWGNVTLAGIALMVVGNTLRDMTSNERLAVERDRTIWHNAAEIWNGSYYCHRCGGVFAPGWSALVDPYQMNAYLLEVAEWQVGPPDPNLANDRRLRWVLPTVVVASVALLAVAENRVPAVDGRPGVHLVARATAIASVASATVLPSPLPDLVAAAAPASLWTEAPQATQTPLRAPAMVPSSKLAATATERATPTMGPTATAASSANVSFNTTKQEAVDAPAPTDGQSVTNATKAPTITATTVVKPTATPLPRPTFTPSPAPLVEVPSIRNVPFDVANAELKRLGFKVVEYKVGWDTMPGDVTGYTPNVQFLPAGSEITVEVSVGEPPFPGTMKLYLSPREITQSSLPVSGTYNIRLMVVGPPNSALTVTIEYSYKRIGLSPPPAIRAKTGPDGTWRTTASLPVQAVSTGIVIYASASGESDSAQLIAS